MTDSSDSRRAEGTRHARVPSCFPSAEGMRQDCVASSFLLRQPHDHASFLCARHTVMHAHLQTHTHTHTQTNMRTRARAHAHAHIHACTHRHKHTHGTWSGEGGGRWLAIIEHCTAVLKRLQLVLQRYRDRGIGGGGCRARCCC